MQYPPASAPRSPSIASSPSPNPDATLMEAWKELSTGILPAKELCDFQEVSSILQFDFYFDRDTLFICIMTLLNSCVFVVGTLG